MGIVRATIRVLTVGLAMLGAGTLMHVVTLWLKIESESFSRFEFPFLAALLVGAAYLFYYRASIPKGYERKNPLVGLVPLFIFAPLAVVLSGLIGAANNATSTELPDWLKASLLLAVLVMAVAATAEWVWHDYTRRRERCELE